MSDANEKPVNAEKRSPADLRAASLAAARKEPSDTRAQVNAHVRRVLAIAAIALTIAFFALGGVTLGERPASFVLHVVLSWTVVAALSALALLRRGVTGLGAPTATLLGIGMAVAPLLAASYLGLHASEASQIGHDHVRALSHPLCFVMTVLFAASPFVVFAALRRGTDPVHPAATGAIAGAASAAIGGVTITMHCPIAADAHVLLGHAMPAVAMLVIGYVLGPRIFGVRATS
jgi:hypothetical protein